MPAPWLGRVYPLEVNTMLLQVTIFSDLHNRMYSDCHYYCYWIKSLSIYIFTLIIIMCKLDLIDALVGITLVVLLRSLMQKGTHLNLRCHKSNLVVTCIVVPTVWLRLVFSLFF